MPAGRLPESQVAALADAIARAGSQSALARHLGISQNAVSKWCRERRALPAEHVLAVEAAYGVSRHDLRPDIYPLDLAGAAEAPTPTDRYNGAQA